jgi:uncharacterized protein YdeI (BOF family)
MPTPRVPFLVLTLAALLKTTVAPPVAAETITPIAEARPGAAVTVRGAVVRSMDEDEIRIADASGELDVYLGPEPPAISDGEEITVRGRMDDDGPRELYAREIVRADGTAILLSQDD